MEAPLKQKVAIFAADLCDFCIIWQCRKAASFGLSRLYHKRYSEVQFRLLIVLLVVVPMSDFFHLNCLLTDAAAGPTYVVVPNSYSSALHM